MQFNILCKMQCIDALCNDYMYKVAMQCIMHSTIVMYCIMQFNVMQGNEYCNVML